MLLQRHRSAQLLLGQGGHGGLGQHLGVGCQKTQHRRRQGAVQHARLIGRTGAGQPGHPGLVGAAGNFNGLRQRLRRALGHDARHLQAGLRQRTQRRLQPGAVARGHPQRHTHLRLRLQRQVQLRRVVEQLVFQQAIKNGAQTRRVALTQHAARQAARWQHDPVPGQDGERHHGHHLGLPVGGWQQGQRQRCAACHRAAVGTLHAVEQRRRVGGLQG